MFTPHQLGIEASDLTSPPHSWVRHILMFDVIEVWITFLLFNSCSHLFLIHIYCDVVLLQMCQRQFLSLISFSINLNSIFEFDYVRVIFFPDLELSFSINLNEFLFRICWISLDFMCYLYILCLTYYILENIKYLNLKYRYKICK